MQMVKGSFENSRILRVITEWLGIGLMAFATFITRPVQMGGTWPQSLHSLYYALSKPVFLFGMVLTLLPTVLGVRGSFFDLILTNRCFVFIARISFCTYLVHLIVMEQFFGTRTYDISYNVLDAFMVNMGILVLSLFFGFLLTMMVELPFANLQKHLVGYLLKSPKAVKKEAKTSLLTSSESFGENKLPHSEG